MFESLMHWVSQSAETGAAIGHSPQTALAAVLCAVMINLFN
ncbi:YshB family small membrane protein [Mixta gaviniae]|nr:YshB family small membrane protein [Mixta gaviniae]